MYPPSSPHVSYSQSHPQASMFRGPAPPLPSPASNGREMPTPPPAHSSMSISSMLDSDTPRPSHTSSQANLTRDIPLKIAGTAASPKWQPALSAPTSSPRVFERAGFVYSKSQSPEKLKVSSAQISEPSGVYSRGTPQRSFSGTIGDPREIPRNGVSPRSFGSQVSPKADAVPRQDWRTFYDKYPNPGRPVVERRNSQPNPYSAPPLIQEATPMVRPTTSETAGLPIAPGAIKAPGGTRASEASTKKQHAVQVDIAAAENLDNRGQRPRDGPLLRATHQETKAQEVVSTSTYPFFNRNPNTPESQKLRKPPKPESSIHRVLERDQPQSQSPYSEESLRRLREERLVAVGLNQQSSNFTLVNPQSRPVERPVERHVERPVERPVEQGSDPQGQTHPRNQHLKIPTADGPSPAGNLDQPVRSEEENGQSQRGSLAHILGDRRGRASPLPQAVQGAQERISGPASDPGIKSEFARMFSGIGTGVGGSAGRKGSGASSPFPPSPTRNLDNERRTPLSGRGDLAELTKPRASSRVGRKGQKAKDDECKQEPKQGNDDGDGRNTLGLGILSARGVKRSRHGHHHHHHHPHNHHHHHHHHDEQSGTPLTNLAHLKRVTTPSQSAPDLPGGSHHHHHHHRHHHHHHHTPKVTVAAPLIAPVLEPVPTLRIPTTKVDSKRILESVQKIPRHHLGSTLYRPSEILPPTYSQPSKPGTISMPKQLPRFEGRENCTITIRIPRFYLKDSEREKVCSRRAVWGTDIYTDDSDPLAAAIHSGWIRGKWPSGIDTSMLELKSNVKNPPSSLDRNSKPKAAAGTTKATPELIHTTTPPEPLLPIPGKDLHLTLLILPALQSYASLVRHGIKSRPLGSRNTHGGMSFAIEKVVWRDGGKGNGEERGGEARRKRMRTTLEGLEGWKGMDVGPPVRLNMIGTGLTTAVQG